MGRVQSMSPLMVTDGQLRYEWQWLLSKLERRSPELAARHRAIELPDPHPLFAQVSGPMADREVVQPMLRQEG